MKYKIIKMIYNDGRYTIESSKIFTSINRIMKYSKNESFFIASIENPTYYELADFTQLKFSSYFVYVICDGKQLLYKDITTMDKEVMELFVTTHIFTDLAVTMNKKEINIKDKIFLFIVGLAAGILGGMFIGQQIQIGNFFKVIP